MWLYLIMTCLTVSCPLEAQTPHVGTGGKTLGECITIQAKEWERLASEGLFIVDNYCQYWPIGEVDAATPKD